ncbi:MAG: benzoyl-CoA-dihydrodiol lyase [Planctomycetota bacterium]
MTANAAPARESARVDFQTHPSRYRHWTLEVDGDIATLSMSVEPFGGQSKDYELKLNSYDLSVDIELADATQRLLFEHPSVRTIIITGGLDRVFCAGANIHMLRSSAHGFKVNFCKYTNETRLYLEDATLSSNKRTLAALNGTASGGGYELALACDKILLVDDRSSAVSFPEVPLLGVLPGTGGLTRIADKRKIRRDLNDVFSTVAEGIKGKRAVRWNLVDRLAPLSRWDAAVAEMAQELAGETPAREDVGIELIPLELKVSDDSYSYKYVDLTLDRNSRVAALTITLPSELGVDSPAAAHAEGAKWWPLQLLRELDNAILNARMNEPELGTITLRVVGDHKVALAMDDLLLSDEHWFTREVRHFAKRVLKRVENTAKSLYAIMDVGTAFAGTFLELALVCDRTYVLNDPDEEVFVGIGRVHDGAYPMANGLTRLQTRFLGDEEGPGRVLEQAGEIIDAEAADELGLATFAPDALDWEDELRIALEERASFSPDSLTGMESNLRFAGPETMETKIFGRLSAWQNWIFQRPNAVGEQGALQCYGTPNRPSFDTKRT